jgi:hypothetical protein
MPSQSGLSWVLAGWWSDSLVPGLTAHFLASASASVRQGDGMSFGDQGCSQHVGLAGTGSKGGYCVRRLRRKGGEIQLVRGGFPEEARFLVQLTCIGCLLFVVYVSIQ